MNSEHVAPKSTDLNRYVIYGLDVFAGSLSHKNLVASLSFLPICICRNACSEESEVVAFFLARNLIRIPEISFITDIDNDMLDIHKDILEKHNDILDLHNDILNIHNDIQVIHKDMLEIYNDMLDIHNDMLDKHSDMWDKYIDMWDMHNDMLDIHNVM
ncbi:unnamed protein product [Mytilus coruscus]|uniref:Uncharacterized protein n=1 Tax=Mytilus coruscus TaxID=42192 RepID=A0A6J8EFH6_MYTCO|nr:unnamed protein product [Mytilus coruscus]